MPDTQAHTESLLDVVRGVDVKAVMLPEFQRDFRWELDQTYDLFDSLVRDIFIGTIIYGKPSFAMTLREIDRRPRKGKGSNAKLQTIDYSADEIKRLAATQNLRLVLDGQQRITCIYRALTGLDTVHIILHEEYKDLADASVRLEDMVYGIHGDESRHQISVKLSDAYAFEIEGLEDEELNDRFAKSRFAQEKVSGFDDAQRQLAQRVYRRAIRKIVDLLKQQKMLAFYLLDMSVDKFCTFFERSNSRGIQLDFTDILAAKLYHGFNLRKAIEEFEEQSHFRLNREVIVRTIAYLVGANSGKPINIDRKFILDALDAEDFRALWQPVCSLYESALNYLAKQHYILSQDWMPSENMVIPIMVFLHHIGGFDRMTEGQRTFLEYWYWSSVFANRYSTASNEAIIADCTALTNVAKGEKIAIRNYFIRMRPLITEYSDLFSYTKRSSAVYKGVLNFLGYASKGLRDWNSTHLIDVTMRLEDHHIYPRAYISSLATHVDMDRIEAEQLVDCVVNRTLIPKLLNIHVGKRAPSDYLKAIKSEVNPNLGESLASHLLPAEMISDTTWNECFGVFLNERAANIFNLIKEITSDRVGSIEAAFGAYGEPNESKPIGVLKLRDLIESGLVLIGDRVFVKKRPDQFGNIVDGDTVEYNGQRLLINLWGQKMTGWPSISIYASVYLERTGQTIGALRES